MGIRLWILYQVLLDADKKNTKENFKIRNEDLRAKRDAIIEMKKVKKYNDEIAD